MAREMPVLELAGAVSAGHETWTIIPFLRQPSRIFLTILPIKASGTGKPPTPHGRERGEVDVVVNQGKSSGMYRLAVGCSSGRPLLSESMLLVGPKKGKP